MIIVTWIFFKLRGNTHFELRDFDKAIQDFDEAIKLNENNKIFWDKRFLSLFRSLSSKFKKYFSIIFLFQDPNLLYAEMV